MNQKQGYKFKGASLFEDDNEDVLERYENMLKEVNSTLLDLRKNLSKRRGCVVEKQEECLRKYGVGVPFIVVYVGENDVFKEITLTEEELMVLRVAVLFNRGIINLLSRTEAIKSLMNKGLVVIGTNGEEGNVLPYNEGLLVVDDLVRHVVVSGESSGFNELMGWAWGNIL